MKRQSVSVIIILFSILFAVSFLNSYFSNQQKIIDLEQRIEIRRENIHKINKQNAKLTTLQSKNIQSIETQNLIYTSRKFFKLYFNWNSWKNYYNNLKEIHKKFPDVAKNDSTFDTSLTSTGTGDSGVSSYHLNKVMTTDNPNQILEIVSQDRYATGSIQHRKFLVSASLVNGNLNLGKPIELD